MIVVLRKYSIYNHAMKNFNNFLDICNGVFKTPFTVM